MAGTATIEFRLMEKRATIWVRDFASLADAVSFSGWLAPYSNAGITRVGFTVSQDLNTAEGAEEFQDMNTYAVCFFRNENKDIVKLVFPAPKIDLYNQVSGRWVLKDVNGQALATMLGMMTGHQLNFRHGSICTR